DQIGRRVLLEREGLDSGAVGDGAGAGGVEADVIALDDIVLGAVDHDADAVARDHVAGGGRGPADQVPLGGVGELDAGAAVADAGVPFGDVAAAPELHLVAGEVLDDQPAQRAVAAGEDEPADPVARGLRAVEHDGLERVGGGAGPGGVGPGAGLRVAVDDDRAG